MTTNNGYSISSIQLDFINPGEHNNISSSLPPTFTSHSPAPPPSHITPTLPKSATQTQKQRPNPPNNTPDVPSETADIFDYRVWTIVNVFVGGILLGLPGLFFSILTRKYKQKGKVKISKICSGLTLALNVLTSFVSLIGLVYLITYYNNPY